MAERSIYEIKADIQELEFDLMEEQFHYKSIPVRKRMTREQLNIRTSCIIIVSLLFLFFSGRSSISFQNPHEGGLFEGLNEAIQMVVFPILAVGLAVLDIVLFYGWIEEMDLMFGRRKKTQNFGASNYIQEEKISKERIMDLQEDIEKLRQELKKAMEARSYEAVQEEKERLKKRQLSMEELDTEEFLAFAYGTWGEAAEDIRMKLSIGIYKDEKKKIIDEIEGLKKNLMVISQYRANVDEKYHDQKMDIIMWFVILSCFCVLELAFCHVPYATLVVGLSAIIFEVLAGIRIGKKYKDITLLYRVEHEYDKVKMTAEERGFVPAEKKKDNIMQQMKEKKHRLEYLEELLSRENEILAGNSTFKG